jgi:hypothetical protein
MATAGAKPPRSSKKSPSETSHPAASDSPGSNCETQMSFGTQAHHAGNRIASIPVATRSQRNKVAVVQVNGKAVDLPEPDQQALETTWS